MSERNRYRIGNEMFTSITDAKYYILRNKENYKTHDGAAYKAIGIYCGCYPVGMYKYIPELKKVVKIS